MVGLEDLHEFLPRDHAVPVFIKDEERELELLLLLGACEVG